MWLDGRCASKDKDPPVYYELTYIFQITTIGEFDDGSETGGERLGKGEVVASECGCALHLQPQRGCVGESSEHEF